MVLPKSVKFLIHDWDVLNALSSWFANGLFFPHKEIIWPLCHVICWVAGISLWWPAADVYCKLCWISSATLNKKVTSAYKYTEAPQSPSQDIHSKKPMEPVLWHTYTVSGGTIMHKNQFLWVIHVSRISGRNSVLLLLLLPPQLIQSLVER